MTAIHSVGSSAAAIFAPYGRDARLVQALLAEAEIPAVICADVTSFQNAISDEACFVVVVDDALRNADLRGITSFVAEQESWSDLPFIILTQRGGGPERNPATSRLSELLGNVTFLERPFHPATFVSVARSALKARRRQFEARTRIEQLHEGEERLRTALLAGRLGSWEFDLETQILTASATCKALFGRDADEPFTYADLISSIHEDDRERMQAAVQASVETGVDYIIEYRNVWRDGSVHWAEIRARLAQGRDGKKRLIGVSSDITQRKAAEDTLKRVNETLEERVAQRTAELQRAHEAVLTEIDQRKRAEEQLRQAQKMEMIGQLTGGVAHDFNNLLMAIIGNLDLLRKRIPNEPKAQRLLSGAMQGAERGAVLTQRLLAFARRQDLKVEAKSLGDLVHGMTELLERSVGSRIELAIDVQDGTPSALVDANQLELALLNLVVNARDAMPEGGVLSIRVDSAKPAPELQLSAGCYVRLTVSDTGQGMDATTLEKATEPFFSTKELGKGTGLGLSMVHGLAIQLNGALTLASEPGLGTTVELWLPVTSAEAASFLPVADAAPTEGAVPSMHILIVDDDPLIVMGTCDMLEDLGHTVEIAHSGDHALELVRNGQAIDLLITDFSMPNMTGMELAEAVRDLRPGLPILLATGYAELPPGGNMDLPRINKPYIQGQLATEIRRLVRRNDDS